MKKDKREVFLKLKNKKHQTIDITATLEVVGNSFYFSSKKDINHLCTILKAQAKNGSDIQGLIYINPMGKKNEK